MAIEPKNEYPAQVITSDPAYPYGKAKNETSPGLKNGTPLEALHVNDLWGFLQSLLVRAGISPSGTPDEVGASQYLDAIDQRFGTTGNLTSVTGELQKGLPTSRILDVSAHESTPVAAIASADGGKLHVTSGISGAVHQYGMSEAFNQDLASFETTWNTGLMAEVEGIAWRPDGSHLYLAGDNLSGFQVVREFQVATPWSIAGSPAAIGTVDINADFDKLRTVSFSPDGLTMYAGGQGPIQEKLVIEYALSPAWDVSSASKVFQLTVLTPSLESYRGHALAADGRRLFACASGSVTEYHLATPYRLSSAFASNRNRPWLNELAPQCYAAVFAPGDAHAYVVQAGTTKVLSLFTSAVRLA